MMQSVLIGLPGSLLLSLIGSAMTASSRPDAVSRFARKVFVVSGVLVACAAAAGPLWAWGRPDRAWGFALGAVAGLAKFAWSVRLVRRLGESSARWQAAERVGGLAFLGVALVVGAVVDGVDLASTAVGVFLATVATIVAAVLETRGAQASPEDAGRD